MEKKAQGQKQLHSHFAGKRLSYKQAVLAKYLITTHTKVRCDGSSLGENLRDRHGNSRDLKDIRSKTAFFKEYVS